MTLAPSREGNSRQAVGQHAQSPSGERVATIVLCRQLPTYAVRSLQLSYVNFDGDEVLVGSNGKVTVHDDPDPTDFFWHF
jgi:hypothetical protein